MCVQAKKLADEERDNVKRAKINVDAQLADVKTSCDTHVAEIVKLKEQLQQCQVMLSGGFEHLSRSFPVLIQV